MLFSVEQEFVGRDEKRALLKTSTWEATWSTEFQCLLYMLWFSFILGLNCISVCFKLIVISPYWKTKRNKIWTKDTAEPQDVPSQVWVIGGIVNDQK